MRVNDALPQIFRRAFMFGSFPAGKPRPVGGELQFVAGTVPRSGIGGQGVDTGRDDIELTEQAKHCAEVQG